MSGLTLLTFKRIFPSNQEHPFSLNILAIDGVRIVLCRLELGDLGLDLIGIDRCVVHLVLDGFGRGLIDVHLGAGRRRRAWRFDLFVGCWNRSRAPALDRQVGPGQEVGRERLRIRLEIPDEHANRVECD